MKFRDDSEINIFGYLLPNDLSSIIASKPTPWSIIDQTNIFDLSSLPINREVIVALLTYTIQSPSQITISWYRERDNYLIFTLSDSLSSGSWSHYASWVGYCTLLSSSVYADEITENGSYRVVFTITGTTNYSETKTFTVSGVGIDYVNFYNSTLGTVKVYSTDPEPLTYPYTAQFNVSSLAENTYYQFVARAYDLNGEYSSQASRTMLIDRTAPVVSITSVTKTNNSITLNVSATDSGSGQNGFVFYLNDASVKTTIYGNTATYTFDNLNQNQQYKVGVRAFDNAMNWSRRVFQNVTTSDRPTLFSWTNSKTQGSQFNLTAQEWNDFTKNINDVRVYKGYSSYSFTVAYTGNDFLATMFNQARSNIGAINATGLTDRYAGNNILASELNLLVTKLNEIT